MFGPKARASEEAPRPALESARGVLDNIASANREFKEIFCEKRDWPVGCQPRFERSANPPWADRSRLGAAIYRPVRVKCRRERRHGDRQREGDTDVYRREHADKASVEKTRGLVPIRGRRIGSIEASEKTSENVESVQNKKLELDNRVTERQKVDAARLLPSPSVVCSNRSGVALSGPVVGA